VISKLIFVAMAVYAKDAGPCSPMTGKNELVQ